MKTMRDLVDRLHQRAASYRLGGPSSEHTAALLDEAAVALASAEASAEYNVGMVEPLRKRIEALQKQNAATLDALKDAVELLERHYPKPARNGQIARARAVLSKAGES